MKTFIRSVKDSDKSIVLKESQMQYYQYLFEKKEDHFDYLPSFC